MPTTTAKASTIPAATEPAIMAQYRQGCGRDQSGDGNSVTLASPGGGGRSVSVAAVESAVRAAGCDGPSVAALPFTPDPSPARGEGRECSAVLPLAARVGAALALADVDGVVGGVA